MSTWTETLKERKRKDRVMERGERARQLIRTALSWQTNAEATAAMAAVLEEERNPRLLAAVWRELEYLGGDYGTRARVVVSKANDLIARELV